MNKATDKKTEPTKMTAKFRITVYKYAYFIPLSLKRHCFLEKQALTEGAVVLFCDHCGLKDKTTWYIFSEVQNWVAIILTEALYV